MFGSFSLGQELGTKKQLRIGVNSYKNYDGPFALVANFERNEIVYYLGCSYYRYIPYYNKDILNSIFLEFDSDKHPYVKKFVQKLTFVIGWQYYPHIKDMPKRLNFYIDYNFVARRMFYIDESDLTKGKIDFLGNYFGLGLRLKFLKICYLTTDAGLVISFNHQMSSTEEYLNIKSSLAAKLGLGINLFRINLKK